MELKIYQQTVIDDLTRFLALLRETSSIQEAYLKFWTEKKVVVGYGGMLPYQNMLPGVPNVCLKVPTGGGKTFIAAFAIKPIFDSLPHTKAKAVVWLVPSDAILEQTVKSLSDPYHSYRQRINTDFSHRVEVYSKSQLLSGQNFNPTVVNEQLSIFVLSYDSFRTSKKEGRKAYQENGNLALFAEYMSDPSILLADTDETALIQVIRFLNPIVIVDESHHAGSPLSKEMLMNFNPSFVLDLTATPTKESNIISYVDALQLKKENMVKLPVIVYNRPSHNDVFMDAITMRNKLESQAKREREKTGRYIRPIVLFQAEPKGNDTTTFDKVKKSLMDVGIPENQIAVKTAEKNELRGVDLLSENCQIRYIITINALKEGWDCSFAYVLATIANRTSAVDVEQILGRILRLPHAAKNENDVLNISYVITSSNDFHATLQRIVTGLNNAGFSEKEYRVGKVDDVPDVFPAPIILEQTHLSPAKTVDADDVSIDVSLIKAQLEVQASADIDVNEDLFKQAIEQMAQYESILQQSNNQDYDAAPMEVREYMNVFRINESFAEEIATLRFPQFAIPLHLPLFNELGMTALTKEALTEGFTLRDKDTVIDFSSIEGEMARVDVSDTTNAVPKAWKLTGADNKFFREWFDSQPPEKRIEQCKHTIMRQLSRINVISDKEMAEYVGRIISGLTSEQLEDLQQSPHIYLAKIKKKIESLMDAHREKVFDLWVEQGKICCEPLYRLTSTISPIKVITTLPKTLYVAEEEMNGLEHDMAWELANLPNIKWWHRNMSRSGFNINGYINAFPDIIAMTESGKILMIEPKGDHLENAESRQKVKIGRAWEKLAGSNYRYYMVFRDKELNVDGAVRFDRFMEIVKGL
jgi:type III restriction enzyme